MAFGALSPRLPTEVPGMHAGGGGRPPKDRSHGGGGGGGRGGDNVPDYGERLRRYRLGMAVGLISIVTLFIGFSAMYLLRQHAAAYDFPTGTLIRNWQPLSLPMNLLWINTVLLVASSATMEMARRQAHHHALLGAVYAIPGIKADEDRGTLWLAVTACLGLGFLAGQWRAWLVMEQHGWFVDSGASSFFFYVLTGAHAVHLLGGLAAMLYVLACTWQKKPAAQRCVVVDVTSWYWHVIAVLWIYLFGLMALAKG